MEVVVFVPIQFLYKSKAIWTWEKKGIWWPVGGWHHDWGGRRNCIIVFEVEGGMTTSDDLQFLAAFVAIAVVNSEIFKTERSRLIMTTSFPLQLPSTEAWETTDLDAIDLTILLQTTCPSYRKVWMHYECPKCHCTKQIRPVSKLQRSVEGRSKLYQLLQLRKKALCHWLSNTKPIRTKIQLKLRDRVAP